MWQKFIHFRTVRWKGGTGVPATQSILVMAVLLAGAVLPCTLFAASAEVPAVSANLGPCSADFVVVDSNNKPIYNAKVHVNIAYGLMSKRKYDLEIGTNSDGKARIEGLPAKLKKPPLDFTIRSADQSKAVVQDPSVECHETFNVQLGKP